MTISIMVCWLNHQVFSAAMQLGDPCDGRVIMRWNSFLKMSIYLYQLYRVLSVHDETSTETLSERKRFFTSPQCFILFPVDSEADESASTAFRDGAEACLTWLRQFAAEIWVEAEDQL